MSGMNLVDLAAAVTAVRGDAIAITGPGAMAGALYVAGPHPATIYNMELAYSTAVGFGMALQRPDSPVVAIEGDGSILAALGVLATIARYRPTNLTVVIIVNGVYATGDNTIRTQTGLGADMAVVARGLGWPDENVTTVETAADAEATLRGAVGSDGPHLVIAMVDRASYSTSPTRPKPGLDVVESAVVLRLHLEGRQPRT